jgi:methionyl-tRNA formyltransferase
MEAHAYIVATIRPWNIQAYHDIIRHYPGRWHLITHASELTPARVRDIQPRYVFFPHWSLAVSKEILAMTQCVCFHETHLPYGRGGSPVQNLIAQGARETVITAFRMVEELDAGPVYLTRPLCLEGLAEEIFVRASRVIAEMIYEIARHEPAPRPQVGAPVVLRRRAPHQSEIASSLSLEALFDHIRMLDATEYPRAFLRYGGFRLEFSRPALRTGAIEADVRIVRAADGAER